MCVRFDTGRNPVRLDHRRPLVTLSNHLVDLWFHRGQGVWVSSMDRVSLPWPRPQLRLPPSTRTRTRTRLTDLDKILLGGDGTRLQTLYDIQQRHITPPLAPSSFGEDWNVEELGRG
jgi:hypothetical protein